MMRIEQIASSVHRKGACLISLEDGTKLTVPKKDVQKLGLKPLDILNHTALKELNLVSDALMKEQLLSMLSRRPYAKEELKKALMHKGASREQADGLLAFACEQGWIDEEDYARCIVEECKRKGYGLYRIKAEFSRRSVPRDLWEHVLCDWTEEEEVIDVLLEKHLKTRDEKGYRNASMALQRRGYSYGDIANAMRRNKERENG